jgi:hypothetical protein
MSHALNESLEELTASMKRTHSALRAAEIPVVLGGGLACWARGGPPTDHDVDFLLRPSDAESALHALTACGMRPERPSEDWLLKAWDGDVLIDLIHHPAGGAVDDALFERSEILPVAAQKMLVASPADILVSKVLALTEQDPDLGPVLELARALREQIDWQFIETKTASTPFGAAFLTLAARLEVRPGGGGKSNLRARSDRRTPDSATIVAIDGSAGR